MRQNLADKRGSLDAGNHAHLTAAALTARQIQLEDPLEPASGSSPLPSAEWAA
jgi:hypothetical protein